MATEAQRRAGQACKARNPAKHSEMNIRYYFKKKWGMSKEEDEIAGCVRYIYFVGYLGKVFFFKCQGHMYNGYFREIDSAKNLIY